MSCAHRCAFQTLQSYYTHHKMFFNLTKFPRIFSSQKKVFELGSVHAVYTPLIFLMRNKELRVSLFWLLPIRKFIPSLRFIYFNYTILFLLTNIQQIKRQIIGC